MAQTHRRARERSFAILQQREREFKLLGVCLAPAGVGVMLQTRQLVGRAMMPLWPCKVVMNVGQSLTDAQPRGLT
jgi:hypothetical protein